MTVRGHALSWAQIRSWAADNQVPPAAQVMVKTWRGDHAPVTGLDGEGTLQLAFGAVPVLWGALAATAPATDELAAVVDAGDYRRIRDLGQWEASEGDPAMFVLQTRWG
jgi:hypothetical protein